MARSTSQTDALQQRINGLMADCESELCAVTQALEQQQSTAAVCIEAIESLGQRLGDLAALGNQLASPGDEVDTLRKQLRDKDARYANLETVHTKALARAVELERQLAKAEKPAQSSGSFQQAEFEAMRTELAARKSLVKNMRADAERSKALEAELAHSREVIATMKQSIERDAKLIAELKLSSNRWERKYLRLTESPTAASQHNAEDFSYSAAFSETVATMFLEQTSEVDGEKTVVIDMTEPLREARDERQRAAGKG